MDGGEVLESLRWPGVFDYRGKGQAINFTH